MGATDVSNASRAATAAPPPPTQSEANLQRADSAWKSASAAHPGATLEVRYNNGQSKVFSDPKALTAQAFDKAISFRIAAPATSDRQGGAHIFAQEIRFDPLPKSFQPNTAPKGKLDLTPPRNSGVSTAKTTHASKPPGPNDYDGNATLLFPNAKTPLERQNATRDLQTQLISLKFLAPGTADHKAGPATLDGLRKGFAKTYGLPENTPLNELAALVKTLKGEPVKASGDGLNGAVDDAMRKYTTARGEVLKNISQTFADKSTATPQQRGDLLHQLQNFDQLASKVSTGLASDAELNELRNYNANPAAIPVSTTLGF